MDRPLTGQKRSTEPARPELGYYFYPRRHPESPGHPRLDVALRPEPTHRHFDPEWVSLSVAAPPEQVEQLTVHYPWRGMGDQFCACVGRVVWGDRKGKTVTAFTFGGDFQVHSKEAYTVCTLTSPAPLLPVSRRFSMPTMLALEVEVLLAERRAAWISDLASCEKRLAGAQPLIFYRACLKTLEEKFQDLVTGTPSETMEQFLLFLQAENDRLDETCEPLKVSALTDLL